MDDRVSEVWQCSLDGALPRRLDLTMPILWGISLHPDGRRIAYIGGTTGKDEVWLLDNYLPPAPSKTAPRK